MANVTSPLKSAMAWQEAWKTGREEVLSFHASAPWEIPAARMSNLPLLTAEDLGEWEGFLSSLGIGTPRKDLDQLSHPGAMVVVTGQQAGALLGPLYVLFKALGARLWADEIARTSGRPCVPVFWVASDDHDLQEVATFSWQGEDDSLHAVNLADGQSRGERSVHREDIRPALIEPLLAKLEATSRETEFRPGILADIRAALEAKNFEAQFLELFRRWLVPLGIVPIVPRLGFLRRKAIPLFQQEIERAGESSQIVLAEGKKLEAHGMTAPLHRAGNEINFFVDMGEIRCRVLFENGTFKALSPHGKKVLGQWNAAQLGELLTSEPERFSPNAILRPLVQDLALPSAAYIAGPTEFVYHGQIGPLYEHFGVGRPAVFPRPNAFLLEPRHSRAFSKLGLSPSELLKSGAQQVITDQLRGAADKDGSSHWTSECKAEWLDLLNDLGDRLKSTVRHAGV